jgi:hypothetical protein
MGSQKVEFRMDDLKLPDADETDALMHHLEGVGLDGPGLDTRPQHLPDHIKAQQ